MGLGRGGPAAAAATAPLVAFLGAVSLLVGPGRPRGSRVRLRGPGSPSDPVRPRPRAGLRALQEFGRAVRPSSRWRHAAPFGARRIAVLIGARVDAFTFLRSRSCSASEGSPAAASSMYTIAIPTAAPATISIRRRLGRAWTTSCDRLLSGGVWAAWAASAPPRRQARGDPRRPAGGGRLIGHLRRVAGVDRPARTLSSPLGSAGVRHTWGWGSAVPK